MPEINTHPCPICSKPTPHQERYPLSVCDDCFDKASDRAGRKLSFFNTDISDSYEAIVEKTGEKYQDHTCYIDDVDISLKLR